MWYTHTQNGGTDLMARPQAMNEGPLLACNHFLSGAQPAVSAIRNDGRPLNAHLSPHTRLHRDMSRMWKWNLGLLFGGLNSQPLRKDP